MSLAVLDTTKLIINGQSVGKYAALQDALRQVEVKETITGASTCTLTVSDPTRALLRSGILAARTSFVLDGAGFELVAVRKTGNDLELEAEDAAVAALRRHNTYLKAAAGTVSRVGFIQRMIRDEPWITVNAAPGALAKVELARGSANATGSTEDAGGTVVAAPGSPLGNFGLDPNAGKTGTLSAALASKKKASKKDRQVAAGARLPEDTWEAAGRIAGEIGWRVFAVRGVITVAPDSWILTHGTPYPVTEASPGVDLIDFDYDVGKPAASARLTIRCGTTTTFPAGSKVTLSDQGPANGDWLTETITRTDRSDYADVTLIRPLPALPEPTSTTASALGNDGDGGYPLGDYGLDSLGADTVGAASPSEHVEAFVQLALAQAGKPYVWGASGPNSFDCSGLTQYCAGQVLARFDSGGLPVARDASDRRGDYPKPVSSQLAISRRAGAIMTVQQAIATRGALLIRGPNGHIAISLGNGKTIEARGRAYGVNVFPAIGRDWTTGAWVPGLRPVITTGRDGTRGD